MPDNNQSCPLHSVRPDPTRRRRSDCTCNQNPFCGRTRKGKSRANKHPFTFIDLKGPTYYYLLRWVLKNKIDLRES